MLRKLSVVTVPLLVSSAVLVTVADNSASGDQPPEGRSSQERSEATNYRQLHAALTDGKSVAVIVDFRQCTNEAGEKGPEVTGGLHIKSFHSTHDRISFSDVPDTLDQQNHKATEYIRYRVASDGKVSIKTTTTDADDTVIRAVGLQCSIGKGVDFTWPTGWNP